MNRFIILLLLCATTAGAREWQATPESLQQVLMQARSGDSLILSAGRYEAPIQLRRLSHLTISAAEGAEVIIDGSRALPQAWVPWKDGIWKQTIDFDVWQLFNDDQLVYVARWPDATFEDGKIWRMMEGMRSTDGGYNKRKHAWGGQSRLGLAYDDRFHEPKNTGFREGDTRFLIDPSIGFDKQTCSLAETGKDFTGAVAVLNLGHWLTWSRPITAHAAGSDHFSYDPSGIELSEVHAFSAYHILGLAALDRPNEWWFDAATKAIYFMPPQGIDPNKLALRGRVRDFGLDLQKCSEITVSGLRFQAAGFFVNSCSDVEVRDCTFNYPATHKFMFGEFDWFQSFNPAKTANKMSSFHLGENNRFINNIVRWSNAPLGFRSKGMRVENCLFTDIEWELNSNGSSGSILMGEAGVFRQNTVRRCGNSEGIRGTEPGATIVLNYLSDMSNLQHDGAALNIGTKDHARALVAQNWAHDCNRQGMRFDYHGTGVYRPDGSIYGDGTYMRNVSWNTQPSEIKGDRHLVLNNTVISVNCHPDPFQEVVTISLQGFKALHDISGNENSLARNNLARMGSRSFFLDQEPKKWWKRSDGSMMPMAHVLPGQTDHNLREPGASWLYLRDPANWDFRPKAGSPLVDAGAPVGQDEIPSSVSRFSSLKFEGDAPDIGAYEFGDERYWIPGRREARASTPIPKDGGAHVPLDADLMFLEAYQCEQHQVYFGTAPDTLKSVALLTDLSGNIVNLPELKPNTTYYWRVDAINAEGQNLQGTVWRFSTAQ